jgi:hypothetical protein
MAGNGMSAPLPPGLRAAIAGGKGNIPVGAHSLESIAEIEGDHAAAPPRNAIITGAGGKGSGGLAAADVLQLLSRWGKSLPKEPEPEPEPAAGRADANPTKPSALAALKLLRSPSLDSEASESATTAKSIYRDRVKNDLDSRQAQGGSCGCGARRPPEVRMKSVPDHMSAAAQLIAQGCVMLYHKSGGCPSIIALSPLPSWHWGDS